ncbi:hypothetical protein ACO2KH_12965 [Leptospira terpstrae]|uniref:hypothetical protein n=1 Tax=Leptospira terpstrae TaxID=293075 RepID=UPI003D054D6A
MAESEKPENITIEAEYILQNGKKSKLINNTDEEFSVKLRDNYLEFDVSQNFFISKIHFSVEHVDTNRFKLEIKDIINEKYEKLITSDSGSDEERVAFPVGRIIRKFRLYYDKSYLDWTKPILKAIRIEGYPISLLEPFYLQLIDINETETKSIEKINQEKSTLENDKKNLSVAKTEFESQKATLDQQILDRKTTLVEINKSITEAEKNKADTIAFYEIEKVKLEDMNSKLSSSQTNVAQAEALVAQKENEKQNLTLEVSELQTKLRNFRKTFASYPNEYAYFNKISNWYIAFYSILLVIPVGVLGYVLRKLFQGSIDLTTIYSKTINLDITAIFLTRLPFVAVAGFLIYGSYEIFKLIAMKIIDTQSEKLALSKISIIAQEASNLSSVGLSLSDEQIQDANIYLRMEMIKAYMKETIGKDFEYKVRDFAILDSVKDQIISRLMPKSWKTILNGELGKKNEPTV